MKSVKAHLESTTENAAEHVSCSFKEQPWKENLLFTYPCLSLVSIDKNVTVALQVMWIQGVKPLDQ